METNERNNEGNDPRPEYRYRFREDEIDWDEMSRFGLDRNYLESRGYLDGMLRGNKTEKTVPVHLRFPNLELHADAKLSFNRSPNGGVMLRMHGVRLHPELERPFLGHRFTDVEKKNLIETGNLGGKIMITTPEGTPREAYVSLDRTTNEICAISASRIRIPDTIKGVTLSEEQKRALGDGKPVVVEDMVSSNGTKFTAVLQVNADRKGIEFSFPKEPRQEYSRICGVELSDAQREALREGRAVLIERMRSRDGGLFSSFVKMDPETRVPRFTKYNPDTPKGNREIVIPRVIGGRELTERQRDMLRKGQCVGTYGVTNSGGEKFDALVRLDTETGAMSYRRAEYVGEKLDFTIPDRVLGAELDEIQKFDLAHGHPVEVDGMKSPKEGQDLKYVRVDYIHSSLSFYSDRKAAIDGAKPDHVIKAGPAEMETQAPLRKQAVEQGTRKSKGIKM